MSDKSFRDIKILTSAEIRSLVGMEDAVKFMLHRTGRTYTNAEWKAIV